MEQGHSFLRTMREKTERAMAFLEEPDADQLREEVDTHLSQLEGLMVGLRTEHSSLEKCISLSKDFLDKYKAQAQWLAETKALLSSPIELKAELYQKKAQLAKYKVHRLADVMLICLVAHMLLCLLLITSTSRSISICLSVCPSI